MDGFAQIWKSDKEAVAGYTREMRRGRYDVVNSAVKCSRRQWRVLIDWTGRSYNRAAPTIIIGGGGCRVRSLTAIDGAEVGAEHPQPCKLRPGLVHTED